MFYFLLYIAQKINLTRVPNWLIFTDILMTSLVSQPTAPRWISLTSLKPSISSTPPSNSPPPSPGPASHSLMSINLSSNPLSFKINTFIHYKPTDLLALFLLYFGSLTRSSLFRWRSLDRNIEFYNEIFQHCKKKTCVPFLPLFIIFIMPCHMELCLFLAKKSMICPEALFQSKILKVPSTFSSPKVLEITKIFRWLLTLRLTNLLHKCMHRGKMRGLNHFSFQLFDWFLPSWVVFFLRELATEFLNLLVHLLLRNEVKREIIVNNILKYQL